jgi:hypothetical protein
MVLYRPDPEGDEVIGSATIVRRRAVDNLSSCQ